MTPAHATDNKMLTVEYWRDRQPRTPDEMAALAELVALVLGWEQIVVAMADYVGWSPMWKWRNLVQRTYPDYPRDLAVCRDALYETFKFKQTHWVISERCCTILIPEGNVVINRYADTEEVACCLALVDWFALPSTQEQIKHDHLR